MSLNIELMAEYEAEKEVKKAECKKENQIEWQEPIQFDDYMLPPFRSMCFQDGYVIMWKE